MMVVRRVAAGRDLEDAHRKIRRTVARRDRELHLTILRAVHLDFLGGDLLEAGDFHGENL